MGMLSIVRSGPQTLIAGSNELESIDEAICMVGGIKMTWEEIYQIAGENTTILAMTSQKHENITKEDVDRFYYFDKRSSQVLCELVDKKVTNKLDFIRLAPKLIVFRVLGHGDKIIEEVKNDYEAKEGHFFELLNSNNHGTVIWFTEDHLSKSIGFDQIYEQALFIDRDDKDLIREIKNHDLKYINKGVSKKSWHEVTIKIYDAAGNYMLHYNRLIQIIQALELGVVLGESWGKDSATVFLSVGVYRLRLFTFHNPKYIKKVLMGLEYDGEGQRFVDLDVFHHFMKIGSTDVGEKKYPSKKALAEHYREYILDHLNKKSKAKFLLEEKRISDLNNV